MEQNQLIKAIQEALGTEETGAALIDVARKAHQAEQELAFLNDEKWERRAEEQKATYDASVSKKKKNEAPYGAPSQ